MTAAYGTAWDVSTDIHPTFRSLTSNAPGDAAARLILANALVRALDTPPGSDPSAPDRGYDLKRLILLELNQGQLDGEAQLMADEIEKDERVTNADVTVDQVRSAGGISATIVISVTPDFGGPFEFTITASEAAIKVTLA